VGLYAPAASSPGQAAEKPEPISFNRDIRPILSKHCWPCHGADEAILKTTGDLRLTSHEGATQDRGGYAAVVPGKPEASMLVKRIRAPKPMTMPPEAPGVEPLTEAQKALLELWIREGAAYEGHWAFQAPRKSPFPSVRDAIWPKTGVDRFVLARLEAEGLRPEPEADRRTLIRRATLALTGLPPTTAEVQAFLADRRHGAYERLVDRLLASPRYGENQARYWLDAVRYADTHGLHIDNERAVFPYRDWVVRALNEDLPFDRFTIWQLAGDLLPQPTLDQKIATGYVRMNPTTNEGGVIEAEFLAKNTFDRLDTTSTIFLGLSVGCAKCHDHKYDPISIREYYQMYAFFNSTQDPVLDGNLKLHQPVMKAPTPEQAERFEALERHLREQESRVDRAQALAWLTANAPIMPTLGPWEKSETIQYKSFDEAFGPAEKNVERFPSGLEFKPFALKEEELKGAVVGKENAAAYLKTTLTAPQRGEFALRLGSDDAIRVWLNGEEIHANKVLRGLAANQDTIALRLREGPNGLVIKVVNAGAGDGVFFGLGDLKAKRLSAARTTLERKESDAKAVREAVAAFLELGPETAAASAYRRTVEAYRKLDAEIPFTYIAREMPKPRPTYVLKRGNYDTPGERVDRAIPKVFGDWIPGRPRNRLGLAQWLVDRRNPLTARVTVNRIWQQHFGLGIVRSSEDFGNRGEYPSHPELLDYLAVRFMEEGWSLKKLHREILTSATYRQSSAVSAAKRARDPENVLLARGPRFRLDAEVIRDQALYLSGLLVERPGGRGDKPYQPSGLWEAIAYPISDTARYVQDKGDALYRRSLYLFWKRTSPPPTMLIFDAPMRESCVVQRSRTNTPTQALATLNETGFVEAARKMAERVMRAKATDELRLDYAFRVATLRPPTEREAEVLRELLDGRRAFYEKHPSAAEKLLQVGESVRDPGLSASDLAAWTLVCNAILNLDEVLTLQ
jgi:hypothetical protein